jgi:hypothetical protein
MRLIERLAQKYDPSLGGAIGMVGSMIILGTVVAAPVAAVIGAGAAALGGASALAGALWGGGIVAGGAAAIIGSIALPQMIYAQCYKHELRKHVAAGGSTSGMKWVPGIEDMRRPSTFTQKSGISKLFGKGKTKQNTPPEQPPPPDAPKP